MMKAKEISLSIIFIAGALICAKSVHAKGPEIGKARALRSDASVESIDLEGEKARVQDELSIFKPSEQLAMVDNEQRIFSKSLKSNSLAAASTALAMQPIEMKSHLIGFRGFLQDFKSSDKKEVKNAHKLLKENRKLLTTILKKEKEEAALAEKKAKAVEKMQIKVSRASEPKRYQSADMRHGAEILVRGFNSHSKKAEALEGSDRNKSESRAKPRGVVGPPMDAKDLLNTCRGGNCAAN